MTPWQSQLCLAIGGRAGTGKSTVARILRHFLGSPPPALWLNPDVVRKELAGVSFDQRLPAEFYSEARRHEVYRVVQQRAREALQIGKTVIWDASFDQAVRRDMVETLAAEQNVRFRGVILEAQQELRIKRVGERKNDASDADARYIESAERSDFMPGSSPLWASIDASGSIDQTIALILNTMSR